jgi:small-conductance mechanosensitive channel/CRP-like cAMP-binding protein
MTTAWFAQIPPLESTFGAPLLGGWGEVTLVVLIVLQLALMPRHERRTVFLPLTLLLSNLFLLAIRRLLPPDSWPHVPLGILALFLMMLGIGRSGFLLIFRVLFPRLHRPLPKIFLDIIQGVVYLAAVVVTLSLAGVEPLSLLTGSALVTAIIGLSLRDTLGNLFAGLAIQMQNPFEVGDWIQFDKDPTHIGQVAEINWRVTTVVTHDEVEVVVPNSVLGQGITVNFSKPNRLARRSVYVHAPLDVPPQTVQRILREAVAGAWGVVADPAPSVITLSFDDRGVQYWIRFYTLDFDKRDRIDSGVRDRVWYALHRHGIAIPAPRRAVAMTEVPAESPQPRVEARLADRERALRRVDVFRPLSPEDLRRLADLAETRLYCAGEVVIRQGDHGEELFVVRRGEVAVTRETPGEGAFDVSRMGKGSFFGEMSLLTGAPRTATVRAVEECELLVVGKAAFRGFLETSPDLAERVSKVMAERLANQERLAAEVRSHLAEEHAHEERHKPLLRLIQEFFGQ